MVDRCWSCLIYTSMGQDPGTLVNIQQMTKPVFRCWDVSYYPCLGYLLLTHNHLIQIRYQFITITIISLKKKKRCIDLQISFLLEIMVDPLLVIYGYLPSTIWIYMVDLWQIHHHRPFLLSGDEFLWDHELVDPAGGNPSSDHQPLVNWEPDHHHPTTIILVTIIMMVNCQISHPY